MPHNVRVLSLDTDPSIIHEMRKVPAADAGIRHMLPKARHYLVKLENVNLTAALILKETFLSNGGEAALRRDAVECVGESSDVLLSGTRKTYQLALRTMLEHRFGLGDIASEIEAAIRHYDSTPQVPRSGPSLDARLGRMFDAIGSRTLVMGILNVTPDSFSDGGQFADRKVAVDHGVAMVERGADIIDIGGESTRPGSELVSVEEEIERVVSVIRDLSRAVDVPISIDTYKAAVAEAALDAGALIVNDISAGLFDPQMPNLIARTQCPAILMHIKGTPTSMHEHPVYDDLMAEVCGFLRERVNALVDAGANERMLIIDPGFGFGKTVSQNLELLKRLRELKSIGRPILVGTSRKSTIGTVLGGLPVQERLEGTATTVAISIANGADIVRVHDVTEMARAARMADAIVRAGDA